jgi:ectoine hydroxylase-related dioxygenase (phytanoyl-CoA dioxygenase family)
MPSPMSYGVTERTHGTDEFDLAVEEIEIRGYTVIESGLLAAELEDYRRRLDAIYASQLEEVGGSDNIVRINDANVTRCPFAYDPAFLDLAVHPKVLEIARRLLGDNFVLMMQNGVTNPPAQEHFQSRWHRDLNYQHWVCSRPLALHALFCLDPFAPETGGTWMLPGTHLVESFPSDAYVTRHQIPISAPPGAVVVGNAMLYHRAGENSSNQTRRAVNHVIGRPFLAQQLDLPRMLAGRWSDDPFLSKYLGYRWNPKPSVAEWRRDRLAESGR